MQMIAIVYFFRINSVDHIGKNLKKTLDYLEYLKTLVRFTFNTVVCLSNIAKIVVIYTKKS